MFYDPAEGQPTPAAELIKTAGRQLKAIKFTRPFPQHGFVGIHYWFEDAGRTPFSEERGDSARLEPRRHLRLRPALCVKMLDGRPLLPATWNARKGDGLEGCGWPCRPLGAGGFNADL